MNNEEIFEQLADEILKSIPLEKQEDFNKVVVDLMRKQIYRDHPNADPMIVEFVLDLFNNIATEMKDDSEEFGRAFGSAARKTFQAFYGG